MVNGEGNGLEKLGVVEEGAMIGFLTSNGYGLQMRVHKWDERASEKLNVVSTYCSHGFTTRFEVVLGRPLRSATSQAAAFAPPTLRSFHILSLRH